MPTRPRKNKIFSFTRLVPSGVLLQPERSTPEHPLSKAWLPSPDPLTLLQHGACVLYVHDQMTSVGVAGSPARERPTMSAATSMVEARCIARALAPWRGLCSLAVMMSLVRVCFLVLGCTSPDSPKQSHLWALDSYDGSSPAKWEQMLVRV